MTKPIIFIDGEAGTTGLEIRKRLAPRADIERVVPLEYARPSVAQSNKLTRL